MNKLERQYSEHLDLQVSLGLVAGWQYESIKFRLADLTWWTPDFVVYLPNGEIEIHETKGFMQDDANVKIKVFAELYPFRTILVKWKEGAWQFKEYAA